ncbi:MAG: hypothetical protein LBQ68_02040 [Clostridiales bacterium]|jgi:hypothetical protein|nr:hypothetical protein [Clostridiales bacterium]
MIENYKACVRFKSFNPGLKFAHRDMHMVNCKDCVYFSARNCGMDTILSVEPEMSYFL